MSLPLHIIILAAGDGTRMRSSRPKVLHALGGRPMLAHVVDCAIQLDAKQVHIVYNPDATGVPEAITHPGINWVAQAQRLGTGHAVQQAMPDVPAEARVLVLYGDLPLVKASSLKPLLDGDGLRLLTMIPPDAAGYGRIIRNQDGGVTAIVEHKDADETQRATREVNTGILACPAAALRGWLDTLGNDNAQGEYYLTDIVAMAAQAGSGVNAVIAEDAGEFEGANDQAQLAALESAFRHRCAQELMRSGVRIADPARFDLRGHVEAGCDVFIDVNVVLEGEIELGDGVSIGPGCVVRDCRLAAGTRVHAHSVLEGVTTHGACEIGPFARVRPGTELGEGSKVGNFVEIKNSSLGANTKASHLSYLGDSSIGDRVNIGAGTITCNYDGANKHRTEIGDDVFVGSDTQFVAPLKVGQGANIGAGSTITKDVPEGKLTLSRSKQVTVPGWKRPTKVPGDK